MEDVDWLNQQLGDRVVYYAQYPMGHMSFAIAKDMSFFKVDAMALI